MYRLLKELPLKIKNSLVSSLLFGDHWCWDNIAILMAQHNIRVCDNHYHEQQALSILHVQYIEHIAMYFYIIMILLARRICHYK